ncbi:Transglutaminase-like superfamily-domain-containing protein [Stachybotrys elegans]|uniref:Transglutaminase-like superfamily-domain-containing protein n=1 Tax=Stachybotrys elegans TaxID=80388 RepID=A0A8K0SYE3_9HYPO|nr:Transglutaminase-like superfamily-domain-containing protein [Stachybotrys elegans]
MSMDTLPDESVGQMLYYMRPEDLAAAQLVSRRFQRLANEPLLWKRHCQDSFKYWSPEHEFEDKLRQSASDVNWKSLYITRVKRNAKAAQLLAGIIQAPVPREARFEDLCVMGYDVKEYLKKQIATPDDADDVLARRYFSKLALDSIHRMVALQTFDKLGRRMLGGQPGPKKGYLEKILAAYDMFVLYGDDGDIEETGELIQGLADQFLLTQKYWEEKTTRQQAMALVEWLRLNNMTGLADPARTYRWLRNCLIGQALRHEDHESIPVISSSIYCCLAERLGLDAQCCTFPTHVYVVVFARPGETLDGAPAKEGEPVERMYLDPFENDKEITARVLRQRMRELWVNPDAQNYFEPVPPFQIGLRVSENIQATYRQYKQIGTPEMVTLMAGPGKLNMDALHYASTWANILLMSPERTRSGYPFLELFLVHLFREWPEDLWIVKRLLKHYYDCERVFPERIALSSARPYSYAFSEAPLLANRDHDAPVIPFRRNPSANKFVPFRIGEVFYHRRYNWYGVVVNWLVGRGVKPPTPDVIQEHEVYYRCASQDNFSKRDLMIIGNDSMERLTEDDDVSPDMFPTAGQYFRRWDPKARRFISNLKAQYPDD